MHDPELRGGRFVVEIRDPHAQPAPLGTNTNQPGDELGIGFGSFPARIVDLLECGDGIGQTVVIGNDLDA